MALTRSECRRCNGAGVNGPDMTPCEACGGRGHGSVPIQLPALPSLPTVDTDPGESAYAFTQRIEQRAERVLALELEWKKIQTLARREIELESKCAELERALLAERVDKAHAPKRFDRVIVVDRDEDE